MPIYNDLKTIKVLPTPEQVVYDTFSDMGFTSMLDVGTGHGGVFALDFWQNYKGMLRHQACDIYKVRDLPTNWQVKVPVDVENLTKSFKDNEFDYVQCLECLEHVVDTRRALEQLVRVAKKAVYITSADETQHEGPEQEAIEKINGHQKYLLQPQPSDLKELGFEVRIEETQKRQIIAWLIK